VAGAVALAYVVHVLMQHEEADEGVPNRAANGVVKLGAELAESHGIKDEPAETWSWQPRVAVYGRVVPNPQAAAEVRSPFAGTLRADPDTPWPTPGRPVKAGQVLGRVDVRIGVTERLDLEAKLGEARLKQQGADEVVKVLKERVDRLQKFGASEVVSRRELDESLVQLAEARTQSSTAAAAVELWQKAQAALDRPENRSGSAWTEPLTAPAGGEVAELAARPGTAVEAGALVARVVDFSRPLVRLDLPPEVLAAGPPPKAELTAAGTTVSAVLVGPAPQVDVASQLAGSWYEAAGVSGWRPGLFVKALLPGGDAPRQAVAVPAAALLYHQGRVLVYVRVGPGRYERREVHVLGTDGGRAVLADGVAAGEPVVSRQAQVLLSEEFRGAVDND
jgi:cobalt-zinc-cadmium efflux system membrane fusion protein